MARLTVKVGLGSCGLAAGANQVLEALKESDAVKSGKAELKEVGCFGYCSVEPLVEILDEKGLYTLYGNVTPEEVNGIIEAYLDNSPITKNVILNSAKTGIENQNYSKQKRIVLRNVGIIEPTSLDDYLNRNGYKALEKTLLKMKPIQVIEEMKASGLRGRGGAGFSTGKKWEFAHIAKGDKKFVVCNADEGDPGAFMDRSVLEADPHSVIEGMLIAAYAIGADEGYIYVRAEYPLAIEHLKIAIDKAEKAGFIGKNILNTPFSFTLHIKEGAGAFVCGEETALMASIEGKRGMPNVRPPYPSESGLWGNPTNINNVETLANVAWIILNGSEEFAKYGTEESKGTKVFALAGKIKNSGLIEVPMGTTLREVIYEVGGGMKTDSPLKAVQLGGPSGGCLPESLLDTPVDYDSLVDKGAIMGSGGLVVMDETTCIVDVAKFFLNFTQNESCGKCTFCRVGTKRMLEILTKICEGKGKMSDIDLLESLSNNIKKGSLCGLGQSAPNPVLTTLRYFKDEYLTHILDQRCPAGVCTNLVEYNILPDKCIGCTVCARKCPTNAIDGKAREVHIINQDMCIKCGICYESCKFAAITKQ